MFNFRELSLVYEETLKKQVLLKAVSIGGRDL